MTARPAASRRRLLRKHHQRVPRSAPGLSGKAVAARPNGLLPKGSPANRSCIYYRITDAHIHALKGDGAEGKAERIQTLRCQACTTTFSTRRDTPLYRLKTASDRVAQVLSALSEGLDVSAATRVFGHRQATITSWLTPAGAHSATLHDRTFRALHLPTCSWMRFALDCAAEPTACGCGSPLRCSPKSFRCCPAGRSSWLASPSACCSSKRALHLRPTPT